MGVPHEQLEDVHRQGKFIGMLCKFCLAQIPSLQLRSQELGDSHRAFKPLSGIRIRNIKAVHVQNCDAPVAVNHDIVGIHVPHNVSVLMNVVHRPRQVVRHRD